MYVRKQTGLRAKARVYVVYHYHRFASADAKTGMQQLVRHPANQ